tara:strand:+ start:5373 stop:6302 length:930 start_codon:yes stop_codon:yes gene_type:complete
MKFYINIIIIIFCVFGFKSDLYSNIQNKIVLKVNNEIITDFELKNKILSVIILSGEEINQYNIDKVKKPALDSLIQNKLKKIELSKYKIKVNANQMQNYLLSISSNNIENLKNNFRKNNLSYKLYLDEVEIQFKWQSLIYKLYSNKIDISEEEINKELDFLIKDKTSIEEYKISEIEISLDNNNPIEEQVTKIKDIIQTIGFEKTAFQHSISSTSSKNGNLGWVNTDLLTPSVYKILKKMKIGEISEPIKKQNNLIFLKLSDKKLSSVENIDINEMRKKLINKKKNDLFDLYSRSHLSKLKNSSLIEFK